MSHKFLTDEVVRRCEDTGHAHNFQQLCVVGKLPVASGISGQLFCTICGFVVTTYFPKKNK